MTAKLFETALGIAEPWSVASVAFDETTKDEIKFYPTPTLKRLRINHFR